MKTPAVGDWIRFMYHGQLVVDVITYIVPRASVLANLGYITDDDDPESLCARVAAVLAQEEPS